MISVSGFRVNTSNAPNITTAGLKGKCSDDLMISFSSLSVFVILKLILEVMNTSTKYQLSAVSAYKQ